MPQIECEVTFRFADLDMDEAYEINEWLKGFAYSNIAGNKISKEDLLTTPIGKLLMRSMSFEVPDSGQIDVGNGSVRMQTITATINVL